MPIKDMENFILHKLTDEEINGLTDEDIYNISMYYLQNPLPRESTVQGLMEAQGLKYDDLTDFILGLNVGVCNNANRTDTQIYINRKNSPIKNNIVINLDENREIPDVTIQIQADDFIHEEAYTKEGLEIYRA